MNPALESTVQVQVAVTVAVGDVSNAPSRST